LNTTPPWSDPPVLAGLLAGWRETLGGRPVFKVTAGADWVRVGLEGASRPGIMLTSLPGAAMVFAHDGALPKPVTGALTATRNHPLAKLLGSTTLEGCGMFPDDRIAAFRFQDPAGASFFLVHQMFGARSNTVLLDEQAKVLWARHRPPHSLLAAVPVPDVWSHGSPAGSGDELSAAALEHLAATLARTAAVEARSRLDRKLKSARKLAANLTRDFERAEKGQLYRQRAETLAAHLHELTQGAETITLADPRGGDDIAIALDPALTPAANMEAWFKRARKADKGREIIFARLEEARQDLAVLEKAAQDLAEAEAKQGAPLERLERLQSWQQAHAGLFPARRATGPGGRYGPEEPARPFRRYLVDDRWEVWVGRNNKENDELTHRASHSRDIWLHAQGVPGSHVILRTAGKPDQVPRAVLEKAAGLAAQNSRARHSEIVPVIFTERRYVRKPRKAPAGTAVCLREKSLFAEPGVAPGVVSI
jgi:predicted ribosome quality control (RQC) complex YloA/Tae2 family protein